VFFHRTIIVRPRTRSQILSCLRTRNIIILTVQSWNWTLPSVNWIQTNVSTSSFSNIHFSIILPYQRSNADLPITVSARSKAWTVFACSNTGIVGSHPIRVIGVCVRLFCVLLRVGSSLATGRSPVQGVPPPVYRSRNRKATKVHMGCTATDR
jgi:hypothetical protein